MYEQHKGKKLAQKLMTDIKQENAGKEYKKELKQSHNEFIEWLSFVTRG